MDPFDQRYLSQFSFYAEHKITFMNKHVII